MRFAGYLLANQAGHAASGEIPAPYAVLSYESREQPQLLKFTTDPGSYERVVAAGRIAVNKERKSARTWAFSFDEDLFTSRALMLEVGLGDLETIFLVQRYLHTEGGEFQLVGQVELLTQERISPAAARELEECGWREVIEKGAMQNSEFGEHWLAWRADALTEIEETRHFIGSDSFVCPWGWVPRLTDNKDGWLFYRLIPLEEKGSEPALIMQRVSIPGKETIEAILSYLANNSKTDVLTTETFDLESGLPTGRLLFAVGEDGNRFGQTVTAWDGSSFLLLHAVSQEDLWEETKRACDVVLRSLEPDGRQEEEMGWGGKAKGLLGRWFKRS